MKSLPALVAQGYMFQIVEDAQLPEYAPLKKFVTVLQLKLPRIPKVFNNENTSYAHRTKQNL
jgi:hypothetical protein